MMFREMSLKGCWLSGSSRSAATNGRNQAIALRQLLSAEQNDTNHWC